MKQFLFSFIFLSGCVALVCPQPIRLTRETVAPQRAALKLPLKNPLIVVTKSKRRLELYSDGAVVRTYKVGLGLNPVADKVRQGDRATPEGDFYVFTKNDKSAFYLSLGISYPNIEDAERGLRDKIISRAQHNAIVRAIKLRVAPPQNTALGAISTFTETAPAAIGHGVASRWRMRKLRSCLRRCRSERR